MYYVEETDLERLHTSIDIWIGKQFPSLKFELDSIRSNYDIDVDEAELNEACDKALEELSKVRTFIQNSITSLKEKIEKEETQEEAKHAQKR